MRLSDELDADLSSSLYKSNLKSNSVVIPPVLEMIFPEKLRQTKLCKIYLEKEVQVLAMVVTNEILS